MKDYVGKVSVLFCYPEMLVIRYVIKCDIVERVGKGGTIQVTSVNVNVLQGVPKLVLEL